MENRDILILLAMARLCTPYNYKQLRTSGHSLQELWEADKQTIQSWNIFRAHQLELFCVERKHWTLDRAYSQLEAYDMQAYTLVDNKYPKKLHELYDPPLALFVRGNFEPSRSIIAVVGSRKSSPYAEAQTQQLGRYLAQQAESATISGLAYGIDHTIHQTSLREHGVTYAVLASGINPANISPVAHRAIAEQIIQSNGALLSEYPPGFPADRYTFPARNRIIAALSDATCIMEAAKKSGSLITAQCAIDLHRSVFALPHNNTHPGGTGCNMLIRDGATPLLSPEDLNPFLKHCPQQRTQQQPLDVISQYIKTHPCCTIDDLISEKILSPDTAQIEITKRELSGTITRTPSGLLQLCS